MSPGAAQPWRRQFALEIRSVLAAWWCDGPDTIVDAGEPSTQGAICLAAAMLEKTDPAPTTPFMSLEHPVRDTLGQTREIYSLYVLTCQIQAAALRGRPQNPTAWQVAQQQLAAKLARRERVLASRVWQLWCLWLLEQAGTPTPIPPLDMMKQLVRRHQHSAGHLHELTAETNLDTFTYDELVALHAIGAMAIRTGDAELLAAAQRMARYHYANTQPDNTTHQPWAMGVFAWFPETAPMAQQQLHTVRTAGDQSGLIMALLADALLLIERS